MGANPRPHALMISFYFPPLGMGGVQRALKLAKYLPEFGWDVSVITAVHRSYHVLDESLVEELPDSVNVERVRVPDPGRLFRFQGPVPGQAGRRRSAPLAWTRRLQQYARWPDDKFLFVRPALRAAHRLAERRPFDCVWTTSPPPSVHRVGLALRRHDVGWLADFRDPWLVRLHDWGPTRWHRRYARRLREQIMRTADAVIAANHGIAATLTPLNPRTPVEVIHNGYDEADFAEPRIEATGTEFKVLFYGTLAPAVDPTFAFRLLTEWRHRKPNIELRVVHVGLALGIDTAALAESHGLLGVFQAAGYCPHREAVAHLMDADLIVIPLSGQADLDATVPGRLFEAVRSLRPVLLIASPENEAARLIRQVDGAWQVAPDDLSGGLAALDAIATAPRGDTVRTVESISQFNRREQARQVAALMDRLKRVRPENPT